jgi:MoaA/NifB/PqqE/SkfB family radical SAM enzyme
MDLQPTTPTLTLFNLEEIHVELSSKCTLKCPRCPRTELKPEQLNREITLEEFKRSFDPSTLAKVKKIVFCGDVGDPIYARDFLDIIKYIKSHTWTAVSIVTNGSYKDAEWWQQLGLMLSVNDKVTFSIDGWDQASNEQYRVNSDWDSIIAGAKVLRASSECNITWSCIYFSFNYKKIADISKIAQDLGFNSFEAVRSSKFGYQYFVDGVDPLMPVKQYVSEDHQYRKEHLFFKPPVLDIKLKQVNENAHPWARCLKWTKEMFISVDGLVFPCPWFNSGYQDNDFVQKYADRLSIKTRPLMDILSDPLWEEFITRIETMPLEVCKMKCRDCEK